MMGLRRKYIVIFLMLPFFVFAAVPVVLDNSRVLSYVEKNLPRIGTLKQTWEGFLYIELPDEYVFGVLPLLAEYHVRPPPYFGRGKVGAHITVATAREIANRNFPVVASLGEKIPFSIVHFSKVHLENSLIGSTVYMLIIEAPRILQIRAALGLPLTIGEDYFHITIAVDDPF